MKLLVFSPYYPPHTGGLESHSDEFNKYLSQKGVDITVFTPRLPETGTEEEVRHTGVHILRFPAFEIIHNYPFPKFWEKHFWQLWKTLHNDQPDIVISRTRFFFTSLMAGYFAKKKKVPWVHIEHGSDFTAFNSSFKTFLGKLYDYTLGSLVLHSSKKNIANSLASAQFVKLLSGRNDCQVIYRGVEHQLIKEAAPYFALAHHHQSKTIIGFIGRLIDGKGVFDLIQAITLLKRQDIVCLIVGDGPEKERLYQSIQENHLESTVFLLGSKGFSDAIGIMKIFDIFVNPSYSEGIPTAVIEAALCKKAIIATSVGGTQEIITGHEDGILIPPKDIKALAQHLQALIEKPELRKLYGENAFLSVEKRFSWERAAEEYIKTFEKLT